MKKYFQYSLLSLFGLMLLCATGMAIWSWKTDQEKLRAAEEWARNMAKWNLAVDQFEKFQLKYHQPKEEVELLVRLMRQNPQHELWKELEYKLIFSGERYSSLGGFHLSWPQQTIQLGEESVHILTSQHPCNSRKLVVHTDSRSRILDYQVAHGIQVLEPMVLTVQKLSPQPVVRVACWKRWNSNDTPIVNDLNLTKSSAKIVDSQLIKIINRQQE